MKLIYILRLQLTVMIRDHICAEPLERLSFTNMKKLLSQGDHHLKAFLIAIAMIVSSTSLGLAIASLQQKIVADPNSGEAIYGVDAVNYFIESNQAKGSNQFEYRWKGVVWLFASAANMALFKDSPNYYSPRFGGYDPLDLANGLVVAGQPHIWFIYDWRLYLFSNVGNRDNFIKDSVEIERRANARWAVVQSELSPVN